VPSYGRIGEADEAGRRLPTESLRNRSTQLMRKHSEPPYCSGPRHCDASAQAPRGECDNEQQAPAGPYSARETRGRHSSRPTITAVDPETESPRSAARTLSRHPATSSGPCRRRQRRRPARECVGENARRRDLIWPSSAAPCERVKSTSKPRPLRRRPKQYRRPQAKTEVAEARSVENAMSMKRPWTAHTRSLRRPSGARRQGHEAVVRCVRQA